jgi:hypothetical protein
MRPSLAQILMGAADTLGRDIAPLAADAPFAQGQLGAIGLILACIAQEADRAVETAILEQEALRALFADAARAPLPETLRARIAAAAREERRSLRLSDLEAQRETLTALLAELLEHVEQQHFDWAEDLEKRIWRALKAGTERRTPYLPVL